MADNNHVLQLTAAQLDETLRKVPELEATVGRLSGDIGDIDTALDAILAIQNSYIGGEGA